jgi:hypothetical protein
VGIIAFFIALGYNNNIKKYPVALLKRCCRVILKEEQLSMTGHEVRAQIQAAAPNGRIPCVAAFKLAEKLGLTRSQLGELLNELKIKIIQCQLGCFS